MKRKSKIDLIFGLCWLLSFVSGCTAKLIYETYNAPACLNSVVVGAFVGLGVCFMSLTAITSSIVHGMKTDSFGKKARAILSMIIGIPILFIGLFILWKVAVNLLEMFSI